MNNVCERGICTWNRMVVSWSADQDQTGTWGVKIDHLTLRGEAIINSPQFNSYSTNTNKYPPLLLSSQGNTWSIAPHSRS